LFKQALKGGKRRTRTERLGPAMKYGTDWKMLLQEAGTDSYLNRFLHVID
jgi:hypothetical protein